MAGSPTFAVVSEGPSDHRVLRALLAAYFTDPDIVVHQLQPEGATPGGWTEVLRFRAAIPIHDFVVVQIDTDVCEEPGFDVPRRLDGRERSPAELVLAARERLIAAIGPAVYEAAEAKVLFAVCVDAIECWLLPLYFQDSRRAKTTGCLGALNRALSAHLAFSIDPGGRSTTTSSSARSVCTSARPSWRSPTATRAWRSFSATSTTASPARRSSGRTTTCRPPELGAIARRGGQARVRSGDVFATFHARASAAPRTSHGPARVHVRSRTCSIRAPSPLAPCSSPPP